MKEKPHPDMSFEMEARASGFLCVAGVDEAGRGPLAGPVVAGAVILPVLAEELTGLNDSKQLTAAKRERLFLALLECEQAVCSVGVASVEEIDRFNILRATHLAMARAVEGLALRADFCLVDGVLSYINEHYSEALTLDALAERFFISKYHLLRKFEAQVGTTVHRYILQKRLLNAKQLLAGGLAPSEVCTYCGFGDYANFYRAFRAEYGTTPRQYVQSLRG